MLVPDLLRMHPVVMCLLFGSPRTVSFYTSLNVTSGGILMPGPFLSSKPSAVWVTVVLPMRVVFFSVFLGDTSF